MKNARQKQIVEMLINTGAVNTRELMDHFGVSIETIRRDYNELEKEGLLKKTYGGAVLVSNFLRISEVAAWQERRRTASREKILIARQAAGHIPNGCVLALEVGTTMFELARQLEVRNNLTVLTNDIYVAQELWRNPTNHVYLAGGLLGSANYTVGYLAREFIEKFALIDVFLLSSEGLTLEDGLTTPNAEINDLKKIFLQKASRTIALVDHSKFGKKATLRTCGFEALDLLITDSKAPAGLMKKIREKGLEVEVVKAGDTEEGESGVP